MLMRRIFFSLQPLLTELCHININTVSNYIPSLKDEVYRFFVNKLNQDHFTGIINIDLPPETKNDS